MFPCCLAALPALQRLERAIPLSSALEAQDLRREESGRVAPQVFLKLVLLGSS